MTIAKSAQIHPTAIITNGAKIGNNVKIGPFCCVGPHVEIKDNAILQSHVVIEERTVIGECAYIYPFASLGQRPQDLKYKGEPAKLEIGKNTVIREYVTANIGTEGGGMLTKIGDNCLVMAYCHIAHDCIVGNNVVLVNGVNLSGHVIVEDNAIIGGMSAVKQFSRIGKNAMIGGFSGINRDVIPYGIAWSERDTTLKGLNIVGLKRKGFSASEISTMLEVYKEIFETKTDIKQFTHNVENIKEKYKDNAEIQEIVDFILAKSKNPICTAKSNDH